MALQGELVLVGIPVVLERYMRYIRDDRALCCPVAQKLGGALECRRRRACGGTFLCLRARTRDETCGILGARLELVNQLLPLFLPFLPLLFLEPAQLCCTEFSLLAFSLLLLAKVLGILFFPLNVQLDERSVLLLVSSDASLGLRNVDIIDEVESYARLRLYTMIESVCYTLMSSTSSR